MILVDTSVWIDHLRSNDPDLAGALTAGEVLIHPFVRGEIACGNLRDRAQILSLLGELVPAAVASDDEALQLIETHRLMGRGIGYVDVHLLAAALLTPGASLWTRDRKLAAVAAELGVGPPHGAA